MISRTLGDISSWPRQYQQQPHPTHVLPPGYGVVELNIGGLGGEVETATATAEGVDLLQPEGQSTQVETAEAQAQASELGATQSQTVEVETAEARVLAVGLLTPNTQAGEVDTAEAVAEALGVRGFLAPDSVYDLPPAIVGPSRPGLSHVVGGVPRGSDPVFEVQIVGPSGKPHDTTDDRVDFYWRDDSGESVHITAHPKDASQGRMSLTIPSERLEGTTTLIGRFRVMDGHRVRSSSTWYLIEVGPEVIAL